MEPYKTKNNQTNFNRDKQTKPIINYYLMIFGSSICQKEMDFVRHISLHLTNKSTPNSQDEEEYVTSVVNDIIIVLGFQKLKLNIEKLVE